jgi:respiratory burst oxidase
MHNSGDIVEAAGGGPHERIVPHSGPLGKRSAMRKSARFAESVSAPLAAPHGAPAPRGARSDHDDDDDNDYVEITLDVRDDSVAVHSVKPASGGEDSDVTLLARTLEKRSASYGHGVLRNASTRIKQVSHELRRLASVNRRGAGPSRIDKSKSAAAHALKGLKFISKTDGSAGWTAVEKRFDELSENGLLNRSKFGKCIGKLYTVEETNISPCFQVHLIS